MTRLLLLLLLPLGSASLAQDCPTWALRRNDSSQYPNDVVLRPGGSLVYSYSTNAKDHVAALDEGGHLLWSHRVEGCDVQRLLALADGSTLAVGYTAAPQRSWWARLGPDGDLLQEWTGPSTVLSATYAASETNGWLATAGSEVDSGTGERHLTVCVQDSGGAFRWCRTFSELDAILPVGADDVLALEDGSAVVLWRSLGITSFLTRFDSAGNELWTSGFTESSPIVGRQFLVRAANGDFLTLRSREPVDFEFYVDVVEWDTSGAPVWGTTHYLLAHGAAITPDGTILVAGVRGTNNGVLRELLPSGQVAWSHLYDQHVHAMDLSDDGIAVAGASDPGWVARLGLGGELPHCPWTQDPLSNAGTAQFTLLAPPTLLFSDEVGSTASFATLTDHTPSLVPMCEGPIGTADCTPAVPNSTGVGATLTAFGSPCLVVDRVRLAASDLPPNQVGYFLAGMSDQVVVPPGSQGNLCLAGGPISRYAKDVKSSGPLGRFELPIDLRAIPGHGPIQPGETWRFQAWFRDDNSGPTSNFTDALAIGF